MKLTMNTKAGSSGGMSGQPVEMSNLKKTLASGRRFNPAWYAILPLVMAATGVALFHPTLLHGPASDVGTVELIQPQDIAAPFITPPDFGSALQVKSTTAPEEMVTTAAIPVAVTSAPGQKATAQKIQSPVSDITVATFEVDAASTNTVPALENVALGQAAGGDSTAASLLDASKVGAIATTEACFDVYRTKLSSFIIAFDSLTAVIPQDERVRLQRLIRSLPKCSDAIVEVTGYAQAGYGAPFDPQLSWERAETVLDVFTTQGSNPLQFRLRAQRDSQPESTGYRISGHRVEFSVRKMTTVEMAAAGLSD